MTQLRVEYRSVRRFPQLWVRQRMARTSVAHGQVLRAELERAREFRHHNLLPILAVTESKTNMEVRYPSGPNLTLPTGGGTPPLVLRLLWDVAHALRLPHATDMAHGWLRPTCLCRTTAGRTMVAELGFGLVGDPTVDSEMLPYIAPERIGNITDIRPAGDQYSLGAIAYEWLTGRSHLTNPSNLNEPERFAPPPRSSSVVGDIPPALDSLLVRLLQHEPTSRFASSEDLLREVAHVALSCDVELPGTTYPGSGVPWSHSNGHPNLLQLTFDSPRLPNGFVTVSLGSRRPVMQLRIEASMLLGQYNGVTATSETLSPFLLSKSDAVDRLMTDVVTAVAGLHNVGGRMHLGFDQADQKDAARLANTIAEINGEPALLAGVERWTFGHAPLSYPLTPGWLDGWRTMLTSGWCRVVLTNLLAANRQGDAPAVDDWRGVLQLAFYFRTAASENARGWNRMGAQDHALRILPWITGRRSYFRRMLFPPYADILNTGLGLVSGYPSWLRWATRSVIRLQAR